MIDIFQPRTYEMPQPIPEELLLVEQSRIEKYTTQKWTCARLILSTEGYFRLNGRRQVTDHNAYIHKKSLEMYENIKKLSPDDVIVQISYALDAGLEVGVYIVENSGRVVGCIKGYRSEAMTPEEYEMLWFGPQGR